MSRSAAVLVAFSLLAVPAAWAQAVISARSGMVNYVEGDVRLGGEPVKLNGAIFPEVKPGQTLYTQSGHAEILLTPGVFLRLDRNTSFRMISNKLTDTQVEILNGSALVEADEILKTNRIAVKMGDSKTVLLKTGLYHFNADVGQVRTFEGKARVSNASNSTELKGGRTLSVASSLEPDKFNKKKSKGELYAWSELRDSRLALANISTARSVNSRGFATSLWAWDPYYSMYTFLPRSGMIYSPFGVGWYSPSMVWVVYQPRSTPNYGYSGGNASWQGVAPSSASVSVAPSSNASTGAVGASSGSSSAAVASSAGASRGR
jgi:hypothetical protein